MALQTDHLLRCIQTLEASLDMLRRAPGGSVEYQVFRNAVIKGYELTLETSGKLLRKALRDHMASPQAVDALAFKDVFRHGAKHGLVEAQSLERWFAYRDNRNTTAHDYGEEFATQTLALLEPFLVDARQLARTLGESGGENG